MGLHRAWPEAEIVGVDIKPQPRYPFTFVQADAMTFPLEGYDFIWASPVCKKYTTMSNCRPGVADTHPDYIADLRVRLSRGGIPWVMENVHGSPLDLAIMLCGAMFGLNLYRHRRFETSFAILSPGHPAHRVKASRASHWKAGTVVSVCGHSGSTAEGIERKRAMDIEWMSGDELSQAIPPAYSQYIAEQFSNSDSGVGSQGPHK